MRDWKVIVYRNPVFSKCPECKSGGTLHKSRPRNMREQIVRKFTIFRSFRCKKCGWRGYRSLLVFSHDSGKAMLLYAGLIVVVALVIRFVLLKFIT